MPADAARTKILAIADLYEKDGKPGSRGHNFWGWREIARALRDIATELANDPAPSTPLTLAAYQAGTRTTAQYPRRRLLGLYYTTMGLAGEAGEISNKMSKTIRDDNEKLTDSARAAIADELGDVLWFAAGVAHELGMRLEDIAAANLAKLKNRQQRGTITGSGDAR